MAKRPSTPTASSAASTTATPPPNGRVPAGARDAGGTSKHADKRKGTDKSKAAPPAGTSRSPVSILGKDLTRQVEALRVTPGEKVRLKDHDPRATLGLTKEQGEELLEANRARMAELHELLWADNSRAVLVVLQGMDTSGKDGLIRHVMTGLNPQGVKVVSFKVPTEEEADHDFLWRIHKAVPGKGEIGIFNRSHYESVLVERVMELAPERVWRKRYDQINAFEEMLEESGTHVVKMFLHIGKDEQKERLQARLDDPAKNWKFSPGDLEHRKRWDRYMEAFEELLSRCSPPRAPWHIVPADRKWVRNVAASSIILHELEGMDLKWPKPKVDLRNVVIE